MSGKKILVKLPGIKWADLKEQREESRPTTIKKMVMQPVPRVKKRKVVEEEDGGEEKKEGEEKQRLVFKLKGIWKEGAKGKEEEKEKEGEGEGARLYGRKAEVLRQIHDTSRYNRVAVEMDQEEEGEKKEQSAYWSPYETDKLYDALRVFGSDFTLMEPKFANRSRPQLKAKFNLEEKDNEDAITWALANEFDVPDEIDPFELPFPCQLRGWSQEDLDAYYPVLLQHLENKYGKRYPP